MKPGFSEKGKTTIKTPFIICDFIVTRLANIHY